jgi:hypothetical protein
MGTAFVNGTIFIGDGRILEHATILVDKELIVKVAQGDCSGPQRTPEDITRGPSSSSGLH